MSVKNIKQRINKLAETQGSGRYLVLNANNHSDSDITTFLKLNGVDPEPSDFIVTIRRQSEQSANNLKLLHIINSDGQNPLATKQQRDAAVEAALRANT